MWFYYSLTAALLWGVGQVLVKKGQLAFSPFIDNVIATIIQIFILVPILFLTGIHIKAFQEIIPYAFLVSLLYMTYYYVINKGKLSLTGTLLSTYPIVTITLSFLFLHEKINFLQLASAILIVIGTVILISPEKFSLQPKNIEKKWIMWGIFGLIMVGLAQFLTKAGTLHTDGNTFTFFMGICYLPSLLIYKLIDRKKVTFDVTRSNYKSLLISILGIAMIELDLIPLNLAFANGPASLVSPVLETNVLIMVLFSFLLLKEQLTRIQYFGIFLNFCGLILIGI